MVKVIRRPQETRLSRLGIGKAESYFGISVNFLIHVSKQTCIDLFVNLAAWI